MPNLALSKCWAGSVGAKYSYSASKPADAGWVCSAWYSHAFKNCPTNPSSGHAAAIQGKGRPFSLMDCSQAITSCITGIYSGSSRVTGLTYLQFKRENSQMTKEAMFHSHMLSYSFPLEIQSYLKVKAYWDVWAAPPSCLKTETCVQWLYTHVGEKRHLQSENRWINWTHQH